MRSDGGPCSVFIGPEVGNDGRDGSDELVTSGCKADFRFEIGAGVEVVA